MHDNFRPETDKTVGSIWHLNNPSNNPQQPRTAQFDNQLEQHQRIRPTGSRKQTTSKAVRERKRFESSQNKVQTKV